MQAATHHSGYTACLLILTHEVPVHLARSILSVTMPGADRNRQQLASRLFCTSQWQRQAWVCRQTHCFLAILNLNFKHMSPKRVIYWGGRSARPGMSFTVASSGDGLHFQKAARPCQTPYRKLSINCLASLWEEYASIDTPGEAVMHAAELSRACLTWSAGKLIISCMICSCCADMQFE